MVLRTEAAESGTESRLATVFEPTGVASPM